MPSISNKFKKQAEDLFLEKARSLSEYFRKIL